MFNIIVDQLLLIPLLRFFQKVDKRKVYLDCSWRCDSDFSQREMSYAFSSIEDNVINPRV